MSKFKKPEELAFATTEMISGAVVKIAKGRLITGLGASAIAVGIVATSSSILPVSVFAALYGLWDMSRMRNAGLNLRDAFRGVSQGLGEHDSVHQMDPMKRAFDKVSGYYTRKDLDIVAHYKRNKVTTLAMGGLAVINPLFVPLAISSLIADADLAKLRAVKDSIEDSQKNLRRKYPLSFDQS